MRYKIPEPTTQPRERAFIIGVDFYRQDNLLSVSDSLDELELLAETAGLNVVGQSTQKLDHPNPKTYIGSGKVEEIKYLIEEVQADILLFDDELSPRHLRELETIFSNNVRILDRTALILDIFAQHANTREGSLQVELAQYEYRLPRLTRAWTHLARQAGGGGGRAGSVGGVGLRGPGETQLEVDRRIIWRKISHLKEQLEKVRTHRQQYRQRRKRSRVPVVTLVGYTNAGKSTLLNQISDADVYVADQLFATLDPTTRRVELPGGNLALFTDTVGFIQKLPTQLIAAFRATLEEIADADLLLHVIDVTHPNAQAQAEAVHLTLLELEADQNPIITVLNKIDKLEKPSEAQKILRNFPNSVAVSALNNIGINDLLSLVSIQLFESMKTITVEIPYQKGDLISLFHEFGQVDKLDHTKRGVKIIGRLPNRFFHRFTNYIKK
jgi:GTPase